jgi:hypothetical protein
VIMPRLPRTLIGSVLGALAVLLTALIAGAALKLFGTLVAAAN